MSGIAQTVLFGERAPTQTGYGGSPRFGRSVRCIDTRWAYARRTGLGALDMITAASLLGGLLLFLVPLLQSVRDMDASTDRQAVALRTLGNLVEQAQHGASPHSLSLPPEVMQFLPEAVLEHTSVAESENDTGLHGNRHTLTLSWLEVENIRRRAAISWWTYAAKEQP